ncbi:MAG TPA: zinc ribbon domain-containing protein [Streptosporangiaceae bacterium]|nr:zinc ribbon domain-containing protein [Streptosporangiaceae bacterium]
MGVLVDYRCTRCAGVTEQRVPAPPPPQRACPACGGIARRVFAPVGVIGRSRPPAGVPAPGTGAPAGSGSARPDRGGARGPGAAAPLCLRYRDVPGLCHMAPSAARAWIARARGDNRALDRELERQEQAAGEGSGGPPVVTHHHVGQEKTARDKDAP